jgi:uncharacterized protein
MQKQVQLKLSPSEAADESVIRQYAAMACGIGLGQLTGFTIEKRSLDARSKQIWILLTLLVFIEEPPKPRELNRVFLRDVSHSKHRVIIVGTGPAGLFAAIKLIENGIQPVLLERGKEVRARRKDLAVLNKEGLVNPESNYCFGEGGAGTYSDGKLYTRSTKRGDVQRILQILVQFGALENILYESHPHIGTNKLPGIITSMRTQIQDCGGVFHFGHKVTGLKIDKDSLSGVITSDDQVLLADAVVLATGHSARDIFRMLHLRGILLESKPFALGVRVEHPQQLIDCIQYGLKPNLSSHLAGNLPPSNASTLHLPPSSYSLVNQAEGRGVFSFCMCPGGIIAPASTSPGELVVNGWSPSKRNNPFANSGIVVTVEQKDLKPFFQYGPLAGMHFQQHCETKAFELGGGKLQAPSQRLVDFVTNKRSSTLPPCSYLPGVQSAELKEVLPAFVTECLRKSFPAFGKKMKGYFTNDAVVVATESRTSSPVRIPRDPKSLEHPQIKNLYPCGEGAGYAGGIVSAAMDGEKVAAVLVERFLGHAPAV